MTVLKIEYTLTDRWIKLNHLKISTIYKIVINLFWDSAPICIFLRL